MTGITTDGDDSLRAACRARAVVEVLDVRSPGWERKSWIRRVLLTWANDAEIRRRTRELMPKGNKRVLF